MLDPQRVPLTHPLARVVKRAADRVYGSENVVLYPTSAGSGPRFLFRSILGLPMVSDVGNQNAGSNNHGPNENIRIADYLQSVEHLVYLFEEFGKVDGVVSNAGILRDEPNTACWGAPDNEVKCHDQLPGPQTWALVGASKDGAKKVTYDGEDTYKACNEGSYESVWSADKGGCREFKMEARGFQGAC
jgi:hypothetical protein